MKKVYEIETRSFRTHICLLQGCKTPEEKADKIMEKAYCLSPVILNAERFDDKDKAVEMFKKWGCNKIHIYINEIDESAYCEWDEITETTINDDGTEEGNGYITEYCDIPDFKYMEMNNDKRI